jgi:hypothetical protein
MTPPLPITRICQSIRRESVDMICEFANNSMPRVGRGALCRRRRRHLACVRALVQVLGMDLQTDAALGVFQKGLQDGESVEVSHRVNFPLSSIPTSSRSVYYRPPFSISPHPIQTNSHNLSHSCNRCSIPSPDYPTPISRSS